MLLWHLNLIKVIRSDIKVQSSVEMIITQNLTDAWGKKTEDSIKSYVEYINMQLFSLNTCQNHQKYIAHNHDDACNENTV